MRTNVLSALKNAEFKAWALVVDKTTMPDPLRVLDGMDFYLYLVTELINRIPIKTREKSTLILDEVGSANVALVKLKRMFKVRGIRHGFSRIFFRRSRSEDLVAGSILRRDSKNDSEAFEYIKDKMVDVFEF